ncbi:hypothetical protein Hanom_Chr08g00705401 [Helianthus anomalus]
MRCDEDELIMYGGKVKEVTRVLMIVLNSFFTLDHCSFTFLFIIYRLQVLSFMFVSDFRRRHLPLKLIGFVLNISKSYTLCPLG